MSNPNEAGNNKGAILAFLIIAFMMIGTPIIIGTTMGWFNLFGILGRNRTGVHGVAVRCIATLPLSDWSGMQDSNLRSSAPKADGLTRLS